MWWLLFLQAVGRKLWCSGMLVFGSLLFLEAKQCHHVVWLKMYQCCSTNNNQLVQPTINLSNSFFILFFPFLLPIGHHKLQQSCFPRRDDGIALPPGCMLGLVAMHFCCFGPIHSVINFLVGQVVDFLWLTIMCIDWAKCHNLAMLQCWVASIFIFFIFTQDGHQGYLVPFLPYNVAENFKTVNLCIDGSTTFDPFSNVPTA